jgi:hypothetical protein
LIRKKKIRTLFDVKQSDLIMYTNLMRVSLDNHLNGQIILPDTIVILNLGDRFNQKISRFPSKLVRLRIGKKYVHKLPELTTLQKLHVGCAYNHKLKLSTSLKELWWFNPNEVPELPHGLTCLRLILDNTWISQKILPKTLTKLMLFGCNITHVPTHVTHLSWDCDGILPILHNNMTSLSLTGNPNRNIDDLLHSLTHLLVNCDININQYSPKLMYLNWVNCDDIPKIPNTLKYLIIGNENCKHGLKCDDCNHILHHSKQTHKKHQLKLPRGLKYLKWACNKHPPKLPKKLTCIQWYSHNIIPILPCTLTTLNIWHHYNHKITTIPTSVINIQVSRDYAYIDELRLLCKNKILFEYD